MFCEGLIPQCNVRVVKLLWVDVGRNTLYEEGRMDEIGSFCRGKRKRDNIRKKG